MNRHIARRIRFGIQRARYEYAMSKISGYALFARQDIDWLSTDPGTRAFIRTYGRLLSKDAPLTIEQYALWLHN